MTSTYSFCRDTTQPMTGTRWWFSTPGAQLLPWDFCLPSPRSFLLCPFCFLDPQLLLSLFTSLCGGAYSSMVSQGLMGCKLFEAFACLKWVYFILHCIDKLICYTFGGRQFKMHLVIIFHSHCCYLNPVLFWFLCCSPCGHKEWDTIGQLNNSNSSDPRTFICDL